MFKRFVKLPINNSFFLFGPRSTGKSTLLREYFSPEKSLWIDLLDPREEDRFARNPHELIDLVQSLPAYKRHIVIDEVQKLPKLLDAVHLLIEKYKDKQFALTGSSARKLKYGGANLLAGRAFVLHLSALSFLEIGVSFDLSRALELGLLPKIWIYENDNDRKQFLEAYALTYLKEEIWAEQLVRKLQPFRRFLEVAAQCNGKIINYANIARDVGVDDKTVKEYYSILEDTLIGFHLDAHHNSFRKRLSQKSKFYFFDRGLVRALTRTLNVPLLAQTSAYGEAFEHFVIAECLKLAEIYHTDYRFSYIRTKDDAEIDLLVDRPGQKTLLIEIKSASQISETMLANFTRLATDFPDGELVCLSQEPRERTQRNVTILPWREGITRYFAG